MYPPDLLYDALDYCRDHIKVIAGIIIAAAVAVGLTVALTGSSSSSPPPTSPSNSIALVPVGSCAGPVTALEQFIKTHPAGSLTYAQSGYATQFAALYDHARAACPISQIAALDQSVVAKWQQSFPRPKLTTPPTTNLPRGIGAPTQSQPPRPTVP
jgi:hypothetical protein